MIFIPTHSGLLQGDARTDGQRPKILLRETKNYWVSRTGTKYRKNGGWPTGENWPLWTLDVETVVKC